MSISGVEHQFVRVPGRGKNWSLMMSSINNPKIEPGDGGIYVTLPAQSWAVWTR